MMNYILQRF